MSREPLKLGVLVSGSGTNLQAIIDATVAGALDAEVVVVVSDNPDAFGLERARQAGIEAVAVDRSVYDSPRDYNAVLRDELVRHGIDYVVMAGYMRLLGVEVLAAFPQRVLNIHPALLPSFAGAHGIEDALAYGVKVTGVTVHIADEEFDRGPIIAQEAVAVLEGDTAQSLAERIHEVEHRIYPAAIQLIAQGRVSIDGRHVRIAP